MPKHQNITEDHTYFHILEKDGTACKGNCMKYWPEYWEGKLYY